MNQYITSTRSPGDPAAVPATDGGGLGGVLQVVGGGAGDGALRPHHRPPAVGHAVGDVRLSQASEQRWHGHSAKVKTLL